MSEPLFDFDEAFTAFGDGIYRFCLRLTGDRSDAEDLTQETFTLAYQGRGSFRGEASLPTWLYRIARNRAGKLLPRRVLQRLIQSNRASVPDAESRLAIEDGVMRLPLPVREAFLLVKVEGLTCADAASVLGTPIGTVKFRVHQAVHSLRAYLEGITGQIKEEPQHVV